MSLIIRTNTTILNEMMAPQVRTFRALLDQAHRAGADTSHAPYAQKILTDMAAGKKRCLPNFFARFPTQPPPLQSDKREDEITIPGGYKVEDVIGTGFSATVFSALEEASGLHRAIKIYHKPDGCIFREAAALLDANDKKLETVLNAKAITCTDEGHPAIILELVSQDLHSYIKDLRAQPHAQRLRNIKCLLLGMTLSVSDFNHKLEFLHGDLKPANFLLECDERGNIVSVKLSDGCSAQDVHDTFTPQRMGTLAYLAPEQRCLRDDDGKLWYIATNGAPTALQERGLVEYFNHRNPQTPFLNNTKNAEVMSLLKVMSAMIIRAADKNARPSTLLEADDYSTLQFQLITACAVLGLPDSLAAIIMSGLSRYPQERRFGDSFELLQTLRNVL